MKNFWEVFKGPDFSDLIIPPPGNLSDPSLLTQPPSPDAESFVRVVESRRSVRVFEPVPIPPEIMEKCFDLALLAPSSSNFCPWEFHWVRKPETKKKLVELCLNQLAASTAPELIVCVGRTNVWKRNREFMLNYFQKSPFKFPRLLHFYYEKVVMLSYAQGPFYLFGFLKSFLFRFVRLFKVQSLPHAGKGEMKCWAAKSTALACENLMLGFTAYGYDSCALEGFDESKVQKLLNLPSDAHIVMVVAAGRKSSADKQFGPRVRFDRSWHIHYH